MLAPVGYFRFEDPAGEVGIETHLMTDGQVALTDSDDLPPDPDGARPAEEPGVAGDGHLASGKSRCSSRQRLPCCNTPSASAIKAPGAALGPSRTGQSALRKPDYPSLLPGHVPDLRLRNLMVIHGKEKGYGSIP